jgi:hypothetical protein
MVFGGVVVQGKQHVAMAFKLIERPGESEGGDEHVA